MRHPVSLKHLGNGTSRLPIWVAVLLACALQLPAWASPPPVPRSQLPRIESQIQGKDPKLQVQALHDLSSLEGNITQDLIRLLPRVLELGRSSDDHVKEAALYVVGQFAWLPEARQKHGREMIKVIGKALDSKTADVRTAALYGGK
jgi:hypothetical protein